MLVSWMQGVVVRTGMKTRMGEVAKLLKNAEETVSPLQHKVRGHHSVHSHCVKLCTQLCCCAITPSDEL